MAIDLLQFSQNQQPILTPIMGGIADIVQQNREKKRLAALQGEYEAAQSAYHTNPRDVEAQANFFRTADAMGKLDFAKDMVSTMDSLAQKNQLQQNMEVYAPLFSGDTAAAKRKLEELVIANENEGDMEEAQEFRRMSQMIDEGKSDQVLSQIGVLSSVLEGGKEAIDVAHSISEARRDEGTFALDLLKAGQDWQGTQAQLDATREVAANDPQYGEFTMRALNYANAVEGGMDIDAGEFNSIITGLRGEWQKKTLPYYTTKTQRATLDRLITSARAETDSQARGLTDISAINTFQRMIDPATVREGDVSLIRSAASLAEKLEAQVANWKSGDVMSKDQRDQMEALSKEIEEAQRKYVDEVLYPSISATHNRVDPEGNTYDEVFSGYTPPDAEEAAVEAEETPAVGGRPTNVMTATGMNLHDLQEQLIKNNSDWMSEEDKEATRNMSEDQLKERFTGGYNYYLPSDTGAADEDTAEVPW